VRTSLLVLLFPVLAVAGQEPDALPDAVALLRRMTVRAVEEADVEVRVRLQNEARLLREQARARFLGKGDEGPEVQLRFYRTGMIVRFPEDLPSPDIERKPQLQGIIERDLENDGPFDSEVLVDYLKEMTGPFWEDDHSIEKTPEDDLLVFAPGWLHRRVAADLLSAEAVQCRTVRATLRLWAVENPAEGLEDPSKAPGARSLASVEWSLRVGQLSSVGSGSVRAATLASTGVLGRIPEGLAAELRVIPSGEGWLVQALLAWRKIHEIVRVETPRGDLLLPRLTELAIEELRTVPSGRDVLLARLGELPPESGERGVVFAVLRLDP
jgi:hypothetical protein